MRRTEMTILAMICLALLAGAAVSEIDLA